ncbi:hypothetical protein F4Z99_09685 [Candidatus Poribacteria bacterium]|nr:hypothetical protein [Candidatus Poribacteria bacterium]MYB01702.1 hypothetical protein [Candidatus Poribacteria bacterium]
MSRKIKHRLLQGGCKSTDFNDWLAEAVCPRLTANHVLALENAMLHKTSRTRELIEATGASLLFLPPYSIIHYSLRTHPTSCVKYYILSNVK